MWIPLRPPLPLFSITVLSLIVAIIHHDRARQHVYLIVSCPILSYAPVNEIERRSRKLSFKVREYWTHMAHLWQSLNDNTHPTNIAASMVEINSVSALDADLGLA
ncbi:hypothetical protein BDN71DRAFT_1221278 [Pleurotus eryngii]|uniref:Secreted protein n=1 Tax=Pleurotus eryngii TaxID=5323 RepID=A0A9P6DCZ0_PLEER|nr:hypothetical protein BDN71DRAFT_1221278 [Pleurotus eryngii]